MCYSALISKHVKNSPELFDSEFVQKWNQPGFSDTKLIPEFHPFTKKSFKQEDGDGRFFPQYLTRIAFAEDGEIAVGPAVYSTWLNAGMDPYKYTSYNARRDNLTSKFWSECFGKNHGFIVLSGFSEWVEVKDLLRANVVSIDEVRSKFSADIEKRKQKVLDAGKKYSPTKVEKTDPRFRKIIIDFTPSDDTTIIVPIIYNIRDNIKGFAMVTDDPLPEVAAAGHDRTPIMLSLNAIREWIYPEGKSSEELLEILNRRSKLHFDHQLAKVE